MIRKLLIIYHRRRMVHHKAKAATYCNGTELPWSKHFTWHNVYAQYHQERMERLEGGK